jgi:Holliday junction DNA helicase RuvA
MVSSLLASVAGTIEGIGVDWADISVGGLTLRVNVPGSTAENIGGVGERARLYTSLQVREDSLTLYGFLGEDERQTFETLLGISGIGPRLALAVLSRFTPGSLALAVDEGDSGAFLAVSGVGKRTASRIILELKGKLDPDWSLGPVTAGDRDVIDALTALGYSDTEARQAVAAIPKDDSLTMDERVREALQRLAGT